MNTIMVVCCTHIPVFGMPNRIVRKWFSLFQGWFYDAQWTRKSRNLFELDR
ncbi:MAG: hypothetical protein WC539_05120 [Nitrospirota bacterium]